MSDITATKTLYLIRHGESTFNEWRTRSLWNFSWIFVRDPMIVDAPLSATGREQVAKLHKLIQSKHLEDIIEVIITSPLTRAIETTIEAFPDTKIPIVDSSCREMLDTACDIGRQPTELAQQFLSQADLDFSNLDPIWWLDSKNVARLRTDDTSSGKTLIPSTPDEVLPLRETAKDVDVRIREFVAKLEERPEQHIAIVGHSSFFKRMLAMRRKLCNCELLEISFDHVRLRYLRQEVNANFLK
ncbi:Phosphoglycerate/bisphosphoglycerate mutase, active site [Plasmopara halstedii]|uniref:Phosphoglycerate/bisphosphoglycerate mutase, active site n=1 Tax=Plasmopara halstedii TaxID=4781 RepID=A0A0N7L3I3_PLAHL|nr:Phosphoglycerate/bisphosphoglycerate mutase, active site [Plasmopara halstedii]CEG35955.1 Phosphoglycerate/bisphosphoglycerate mutase, active site [Plasmopara halstedii]|eukprot:XP_024572324.1 Phosphoglycerate/bisphosphoglycerate mutase, active site [Plasmopara halstedii]